MKTPTAISKDKSILFILPLLIALVITLFLFYIDEGFYDFRWMQNIGNWIVFLFYIAAIYGMLLLIFIPFFRFAPVFILISLKIFFVISFLLLLTFVVFV